jgi:hypothetical protein
VAQDATAAAELIVDLLEPFSAAVPAANTRELPRTSHGQADRLRPALLQGPRRGRPVAWRREVRLALQASPEVRPVPRVHTDLAAPSALAATDEHRTRR